MAYQIPYNQPRIYTNFAQWINRSGISQENHIYYHSSQEDLYANTDFNLHPASNQTLSGIWELEPHNYYKLYPSIDNDISNSVTSIRFYQQFSKLQETGDAIIYPNYNVTLGNLRHLFDSLVTGNGYIALLGTNLYEKNLMFKFVIHHYKRNEENTDFERDGNGNPVIGHFSFVTEPLYNCRQNESTAIGHYTIPESNGTCIASITGATMSINSAYIESIGIELVDKNYVWDNPNTEENEGVPADALNNGNYEDIRIGSIAFGTYWDFPINCDMNLNFSRDYKGVKTSRSLGGYDTTNINYRGAPDWATGSAWSDDLNVETAQGGIPITPDVNQSDYKAFKRTGRRNWALNFKGLRDYQVMGENEVPANTHQYRTATSNGTNYNTDNNEVTTSTGGDYWTYGLHSGGADDFFSNVLNKTYGAEKFIFQPDKEDFSSLAIAKFDQSNFSFKQSSHKFFDIGLKIQEVW
tara:strand:+ start:4212 stop:5612 length:1401 start_codon:yes stop_codon:yes gene_type:complete